MECTRRDFLNVAAAGLTVVGVYGLLPSATYASEEARGAYAQTRADRIHKRSVEEEIIQGGAMPEEVKARAERRIRELRADLYR